MSDDAVPEIIRAAGDQAVAAYRSYFAEAIRNRNTRRLYAYHARRFFRWAESRGLSLEAIDAPALADYAAGIAAAKSRHKATVYLTPVRGLFRHLVTAGCSAKPHAPRPDRVPAGRPVQRIPSR